MDKELKYFGWYLIGSLIMFPIASFIDFAFGLRVMNLGVGETLAFAFAIGVFLGTIFGLILKKNPIHFPWSPW